MSAAGRSIWEMRVETLPLSVAAMIAGTALPQPAGVEHPAEPAGFALALDGSNRKRMPTPPLPISATLVPGILRTRGVEVSSKRLLAALYTGAIPGRREQWRWILTPEDVDAAEVYFREIAALGATKGGAAAVRQAKARQRASRAA